MSNHVEHKKHSAHLGVLFAGIVMAVLLWLTWLLGAAAWTHAKVASQVASAVAAATPSVAAASVAAGQAEASAKTSAPDRAQLFIELGQTGDSFGSFNSLLTAIAGAIVFWAGYLQKEQLNQARTAAAAARAQVEDERTARRKQEFESLFFRLLSLTREVAERIETPPLKTRLQTVVPGGENEYDTVPGRKGAAALDNFASRIAYRWQRRGTPKEQLESLVDRYMRKVYYQAPSALGPYLRMLFQTFKLVAESGLSEQEQVRYSNIARAQIGEGAVLLLALNGWGLYGYKFVPLIERYGLLEHLHPRYRLTFDEALRHGYRDRAFMGNEGRSKLQNAWELTPKLKQFYPHDVGPPRDEDKPAPEDDFESVETRG
ncbi:MAG TPA: putative phage abortive infection protein [Methylibium sp.]|nr:putative phage abortive infection protein [Methylibium sp.]